MRIVMVGYMDLTGPGVVHLYHFANALERRGHEVFVLLDGDPRTVELMEQPPLCRLAQVRFTPYDLHPSLVREIKAFRPDIVHIWTPRNVPARAGLSIKYHMDAKLLIHYEDDEEYLHDFHQGNVLGDLRFFVETLANPHAFMWQHPVVSFLANHFADAFTAICPAYLPRLERQWGKQAFLLYPGVDLKRFHPDVDATDLRQRLGLEGQEVILYSGSISAFHQFDLVLQAFAMVAARRPQARLVQLGQNYIEEQIRGQVRRLGLEERIHFLGVIPHREIHRYLALGDVLVQCGEPNAFNEFRLPAKLPEYLAMGRPVITFSAGIGRELVDGEEVLKTHTGEPEELAACIERVLSDAHLRETLGRGARRKAEALFDWERNTDGLITAYESVLNGSTSLSIGPRVRPSIAREAFGSWWEIHDRRHILIVVGEVPDHPAEEVLQRALTMRNLLEACGHRVSIAVPQQCAGVEGQLVQVQRWTPDGLNLLIWEVDPEVLLFMHWSTLGPLDPFLRRPVVLDLTFGWSSPPGGTGEVLRCLTKVDFFLCGEEEQRRAFLDWATRYGLEIEPEEVATLSLCAAASPSFVPVPAGAGDDFAEHPALESIAPLHRYCTAPFVRRPMPVIPPDQKTFGMLIDEAIRHYRRGGIPTLAKETWGFLQRRLRR